MKLLVDMNLSPRWIAALNEAGWEAVHWSSVGKGNALDAEIMRYAAQLDYVVLTHDITSARFSQPPTAQNPALCKYVQKT